MSLILCPECCTKISNKATTCPHCGYVSDNPSLPISVQDKFEVIDIKEKIYKKIMLSDAE